MNYRSDMIELLEVFMYFFKVSSFYLNYILNINMFFYFCRFKINLLMICKDFVKVDMSWYEIIVLWRKKNREKNYLIFLVFFW